MQFDTFGGELLLGVLEDVIIEDDKGVADLGTGGADGLDKAQLAAAVGRQILDKKHALAVADITLDSGVAAETLGLLADVMHRQAGALGKPGGKRNAGRLAAGHGVEAFIPDVIHDHGAAVIHHLRAHPRKGDDLAAVDIDRALHAGGQGERIVSAEKYRLDLEKHAGHRACDGGFVVSVGHVLCHRGAA